MVKKVIGIQSHEEPVDNGNVRVYGVKSEVVDEQVVWKYNTAEFVNGLSSEVVAQVMCKVHNQVIAEAGSEDEVRRAVKAHLVAKDVVEFYAKLRAEHAELGDETSYEDYRDELKILVPEVPAVWSEDTFKVIVEGVEEVKAQDAVEAVEYVAPVDEVVELDEVTQELVVVTEAVEEVLAVEAKDAVEAVEYVAEVTEGSRPVILEASVPAITEPLRPYVANDVTELVDTDSRLVDYIASVGKEAKLAAIEAISVETNNVQYDAHTRGRADMSSIVALANFTFIQEMVKAMPELEPLYDAVFKSTVDWKGKDNKVHSVQLESVAETGIKAMEEYAKVIGAR